MFVELAAGWQDAKTCQRRCSAAESAARFPVTRARGSSQSATPANMEIAPRMISFRTGKNVMGSCRSDSGSWRIEARNLRTFYNRLRANANLRAIFANSPSAIEFWVRAAVDAGADARKDRDAAGAALDHEVDGNETLQQAGSALHPGIGRATIRRRPRVGCRRTRWAARRSY